MRSSGNADINYNYQYDPGYTFYPQVKDDELQDELLATEFTHVELEIAQNEKSAVAVAQLELDGETFRAASSARRHSKDKHVPEVGLKLAAARALQSIVHQLEKQANGEIKHQQDMKAYRKKQGKA